MNMKIIAFVAGAFLIAAGAALFFLDENRFAFKNLGYIIWGAGLILANLNKENKSLTTVGNVLNIAGPLILIIAFALRYF